jgi:ankyrin repeat protein
MSAAANNTNPEVLTTLLKAGAEVNARKQNGGTALIVAAQYNTNPEVLSVLLKAGADAEAKDNSGKTAFDHAEKNEKLKGTDVYWKLNDARF